MSAHAGIALDHLVVAARTLADGMRWCEATLGITPAPGGKHPLMGTHNRLVSLASDAYPRCYLEIIAIDPDAPAPGRPRWFDLDDAPLQAACAHAPQLVHWVARCDDIEAALAVLAAQGIDGGRVLAASRGSFSWRIAVRDDGRRPMQGLLPTLIQWSGTHPSDKLPASGVELQSLALAQDDPEPLQRALDALNWRGARVHAAPAALRATLLTPRGEVVLGPV